MQLADLDGDGDLDLVGSLIETPAIGETLPTGRVAWWENAGPLGAPCDGLARPMEGLGGWIEHPVSESFIDPTVVRAGDIDGDGDLDIIGDSQTLGGALWWENVDVGDPGTGDATAWTEHAFGAPQAPHNPRLVDFDADGDLDVVSLVVPLARASWWENDAGTWTEHVVVQAQGRAESLVVPADLNGDGDLDLILTHATAGGLSWYENQEAGWVPHVVDSQRQERGVSVGDFDLDGDLDLIGGPRRFSDDLSWFENRLNSGEGFFRRAILSNRHVGQSLPADVDGDGDLDVWVGLDADARGLLLMINQGGAFVETMVDPQHRGDGNLEVGDIDDDGSLDVIARSSAGITWWANDGNWTRHAVSEHHVSTPSPDVAVGDWDRDGDADLAVSLPLSSTVISYEQTDDAWLRRCIDDSAPRVVSVRSQDLDGDGDVELAGFLYGTGEVVWWEPQTDAPWTRSRIGDGFFVPEEGVGPGRGVVRFADVDGDGTEDAIASGPLGGQGGHFWYANGTWARHDLPVNRVEGFDVADLDGDRDLDLLGVYSGSTSWARNEGGNWSVEEIAPPWNYGSTAEHRAGDFDDDGDVDVFRAASPEDGLWTVTVLRNDEQAGDWAETSLGQLGAWYVGDLDGDGRADVVARVDDELRWFVADDDLALWPTTPIPGPAAYETSLADVNGDDAPDVVVVAADGSLLWVASELTWLGDDDDAADDDDSVDDDDATDDDDVSEPTPPPDEEDPPCGAVLSGPATASLWLLLPLAAVRRLRRRPS
jgi:hypothetical protein